MSVAEGTRRSPFSRRPRSRAGAGLSSREAFLLLIPALLPVVVLSVLPLMRGIYLAFTDARAGLDVPTHFIGLDNFRELLHDDLFVNSFKIGLVWAVSVTAIQFVLALGLALLLSQDLRGRWLARSLALVPWAMPSVCSPCTKHRSSTWRAMCGNNSLTCWPHSPCRRKRHRLLITRCCTTVRVRAKVRASSKERISPLSRSRRGL